MRPGRVWDKPSGARSWFAGPKWLRFGFSDSTNLLAEVTGRTYSIRSGRFNLRLEIHHPKETP